MYIIVKNGVTHLLIDADPYLLQICSETNSTNRYHNKNVDNYFICVLLTIYHVKNTSSEVKQIST